MPDIQNRGFRNDDEACALRESSLELSLYALRSSYPLWRWGG